jgi:hypothetical protein
MREARESKALGVEDPGRREGDIRFLVKILVKTRPARQRPDIPGFKGKQGLIPYFKGET